MGNRAVLKGGRFGRGRVYRYCYILTWLMAPLNKCGTFVADCFDIFVDKFIGNNGKYSVPGPRQVWASEAAAVP